jgi:hypothetical protein
MVNHDGELYKVTPADEGISPVNAIMIEGHPRIWGTLSVC